jgi:mycofactocin precursor
MTTTAVETNAETGVEIPPMQPDEGQPDEVHADEVLAEVLVEEISIDGMCGVY